MGSLVVKEVKFNGDNLIAVKDEKTGKVYTGVSYICKGIGLTKDQKDRQVKNVQADLVLNRGCVKFDAGVLDPNNSVTAIDIDYLPLWLAKVTITPKMQQEQPSVTEKLIKYQLEAKDVLASVFTKKILSAMDQLKLHYEVIEQHDEEINDIKEQMSTMKSTVSYIATNTTLGHGQEVCVKKEVNKRVVEVCFGSKSPAYLNKTLRSKIYRNIWKDYKDYFNITSYHDTLKKDFDKAAELINSWKPLGGLLREIQTENNQI